jgi:hypothetical protein
MRGSFKVLRASERFLYLSLPVENKHHFIVALLCVTVHLVGERRERARIRSIFTVCALSGREKTESTD